MHLIVPWDRVALGLQVPALPGEPVPNPVVRAREIQKGVLEVGSAADEDKTLVILGIRK
jgi:hypothetical protein